MYVYGSLAFGCYNPAHSDVDVLVVTRRRMAPETRRALSRVLRSLEPVARLEISFLSRADLEPWRYPTPFDYHFSGDSELHDRTGEYFATEIANARARGVALAGPPAEEVFPEVPDEDFLDSIERDLVWARDHIQEEPGYAVLNACRVVAYRRERVVMSKADAVGGGSALRRRVPSGHRRGGGDLRGRDARACSIAVRSRRWWSGRAMPEPPGSA